MGLIDRIRGRAPEEPVESPEANHIESLMQALTNLSAEDMETLKAVASGTYRSENPDDPTKDYLSLMSQVFGRTFDYGDTSPSTRLQLYQIYDDMDDSVAYISSALDILSDDATQPDQDGVVIKVISESEKVQNLIQGLIDDLQLEDRISTWARYVAKYGDFFIGVQTSDKGISRVIDTVYPSMVNRKDFDGELVAFTVSEGQYEGEYLPPWDYVHFRHKGQMSSHTERLHSITDQSLLASTHDLTSYYGQSVLKAAIKVYAQLRFVENMILLSRLTNSIRRNIFLVNVGEVAPDKAFETIQNYASLLKKNVKLDLEESMYNAQKKTVSYDEDIFIPVADPKNDVRIETVGGDVNIAEQYDLEYLLNKLFSALKIPKAYLNYEQDLNARATLVQLDIRYARSVSGLQQTLRGGLLRLAYIHLALNGVDPENADLDIQLSPVSTIDMEAKRQEEEARMSVAGTLWGLLTSMNDKLSGGGGPAGIPGMIPGAPSPGGGEPKMDLEYGARYICEQYLEMDPDDIDKLLKKNKDESQKSPGDRPSRERRPMIPRRRPHPAGADLSSKYPTITGKADFQRLVESLNTTTKVAEKLLDD